MTSVDELASVTYVEQRHQELLKQINELRGQVRELQYREQESFFERLLRKLAQRYG